VLRLLASVSLLLAGAAFAAAVFRWDEEVLQASAPETATEAASS